jgi:hypothetical protein
VLLALSALLTLLTYIYYNTSFVQHQGRYLFTALIPLALAVAWAGMGQSSRARRALRLRCSWRWQLCWWGMTCWRGGGCRSGRWR